MYYRIWQTVSKFTKGSDRSEKSDKLPDKSGHELYAMMAYGELRRKLKIDPSRKLLELKFEELLKSQQTCIKFKGEIIKGNSDIKISI